MKKLFVILSLSLVFFYSNNAFAVNLNNYSIYKCSNISPPSNWLDNLKTATTNFTAITVGSTTPWNGDFTSSGRIIWYRDNINFSTIILKPVHNNMYIDTGLTDSNNSTSIIVQNAPTASQFIDYFKIYINNDYTINSVTTQRTSGSWYYQLVKIPHNASSPATQTNCLRSSYNFNSNSYNLNLDGFLKFPYAGSSTFPAIQFESAPPSTGGSEVSLNTDTLSTLQGYFNNSVTTINDNTIIKFFALLITFFLVYKIAALFRFRSPR